MTVFHPSEVADIEEVVTWAAAEKELVEIVAGGSKRRLGRSEPAKHTLDVSGLCGIIDYEPSELVITVRAGTKMAEIEAQLSAHHQMFAFEPPDWRMLLGREGEPTLGGVLACNLAGPRRVRAGAARDHFLGFSAVNGWGDAWKAGGRVVKNVTGYDLCKLQAGAYGTLSVLTEVSVKVLPAPETSCSVVLTGLSDQAAIAAMTKALNSQHEVSAAAHLPAEQVARSTVPEIAGLGANVTVMRLEGHRPSVDYRAGALEAVLGPLVRLERQRQRDPLARDRVRAALAGAHRQHHLARLSDALEGARGDPLRAGAHRVGRRILRLGRWPALARSPPGRRRRRLRRGHGSWRAQERRRARDAGPRPRRGPPDRPGVRPAAARARRPDKARESRLRSAVHPEPRPHVQGYVVAMQTSFTPAQLADPDTAELARVIRTCVHCGFCTATCPTYLLLGDELDSPRGRIYLIKDMLEGSKPATEQVVKHIDRCLSCLSCMTTCPSGVNYMHLVDHARHHIEQTYKRPWHQRAIRRLLATVLPRPALFRAALQGSRFGRIFAGVMPGQLTTMLAFAPKSIPPASPVDKPQVFPAQGQRIKRVALLNGCAQQVLAPQINEATIRLLTRHGCEVVVAKGVGCCGALTHHLGMDGHDYARNNILAWSREMDQGGLDAIVINASGCGTTVKDYGFMFRDDRELADKARRVSAMARDISELMVEIGLHRPTRHTGQRVAYHSACSLQHGQQVRTEPKALLAAAGFQVVDVPEAHICCGSAGTYNLLQPELAGRLRDRKVANIERTRPELIAAGNIGCITQIASGTSVPVVHTAELLDWATGGPPPKLQNTRDSPAA